MLTNLLLSKHYHFTLQMLLSLLGAVVSYRYAGMSHDYWLAMLVVFALLAVAPDYLRSAAQARQALRDNLLRWTGGLVCALFVFSLHQSGRLLHEEAGMVILFILVLMFYLETLRQPTWRSCFVCAYLLLLGLLLAYGDAYLGAFVVLAIVGLAASYFARTRLTGVCQ
ncbi:conserved membrane hypothetical protein [Crenothrix polyspora]|uniref:Uncharacterized protein n=1 Tax=Crenothrix polyspora TaxID=360316 RepID=A0A1R4H9C6_9GAMM|nr:hypothetical protein [Crenothrix polyspora]SJM92864.1 conserved membrane hypothetical protein [Crenothrix polyspora]